MPVIAKNDLMEKLKTRIGEDTSEDTISFVEDFTDTINDLEIRANGGGENWEEKYKKLDEDWKKKYTDRFFSPPTPQEETPPIEERNETISFADLFGKKEG